MSDTLGVAEEIAAGVIACAATLHRRWPATHILIVGVLPQANPRELTWSHPGTFYDLPTLSAPPPPLPPTHTYARPSYGFRLRGDLVAL